MAKCGRGLVGACFALLVAGAVPAHAWNDFAHEVVARIAWEELGPEVRNRVLALFRQAPKDCLMHCLDLNQDRRRGCGRFAYRLGDAGSSEDADRILFERAAYWPDLARQLDKYNRPTWHYIGWTWRQGADGSAHDTDLPVAEPNAVSQLVELARSVADPSGRADKRAIHLAGSSTSSATSTSLFTRRRGSPSAATSAKATVAATASVWTSGTVTCTLSGTAPWTAGSGPTTGSRRSRHSPRTRIGRHRPSTSGGPSENSATASTKPTRTESPPKPVPATPSTTPSGPASSPATSRPGQQSPTRSSATLSILPTSTAAKPLPPPTPTSRTTSPCSAPP